MFGKGGGGGKNAFGGGVGNGRYPLTHPLYTSFDIFTFLPSPTLYKYFSSIFFTHPKHTHLKVLISLTPFRL